MGFSEARFKPLSFSSAMGFSEAEDRTDIGSGKNASEKSSGFVKRPSLVRPLNPFFFSSPVGF